MEAQYATARIPVEFNAHKRCVVKTLQYRRHPFHTHSLAKWTHPPCIEIERNESNGSDQLSCFAG